VDRHTRPPRVGDHAVVLGGNIAGLAAAAVLADRFAQVTIVERDVAPPLGDGRPGVPQGRHAHILLPAGLRTLTDLLPGVDDDIRAQGGQVIPAPEFRFFIGHGRLALRDDSLAVVGATRPLLEGVVRERVTALANVTPVDGRVVEGLVADGSRHRITGVRLAPTGATRERTVEADLVVDATGRRSRSPRWLEELGYAAPREQRMEVGVHYSTRLFRRRPGDLEGCRHVLIAAPPGERHGGLALAVEDDRWLVTLVGTVGERPPTELGEFVDYAAGLWQPDLLHLVKRAEPVGEPATGGFPAHLRRRYDRLRRLPERYVVTGDAVCSLSPIYAQGMSVAVGGARELGSVLDGHGLDRIGRRYFRRSRTLVDRAWTLATGADLGDPGVEGPRPPSWRVLDRYVDRVLRAATLDPVAADAFLAVNALVAPPQRLLAPRVAAHVLRPRRSADAPGA
jgi:2-polyprenyl-6-methoxyphenol hydroxylase-like FAD-dependent oxidoreductase